MEKHNEDDRLTFKFASRHAPNFNFNFNFL